MKGPTLIALCLVVLGSALNGATASRFPSDKKATVIEAAGSYPEDVKGAFAKFAALLGGVDNVNKPGPIKGGFRTINWDAPIVPFDMPGTFFRDNVTRGILKKTKGDEFRVSNPLLKDYPGFGDNLFDTFNPQYPKQFQAFSKPRIFSPLTDNVFTEEFSIPASKNNEPALIAAYGSIFVDVDNKADTSLEFYDAWGKSLGKFYVKPAAQGLSFLGVDFKKPIVAKVVIRLGNVRLNADDYPPRNDVVVIDDIIYSEPVPLKKGGFVAPKPLPKKDAGKKGVKKISFKAWPVTG